MAQKQDKIHSFEYKAEMKQLLNLIIHSLYQLLAHLSTNSPLNRSINLFYLFLL